MRMSWKFQLLPKSLGSGPQNWVLGEESDLIQEISSSLLTIIFDSFFFAEIGVTLAVCLLTFPLGSHIELNIFIVFCQSDPLVRFQTSPIVIMHLTSGDWVLPLHLLFWCLWFPLPSVRPSLMASPITTTGKWRRIASVPLSIPGPHPTASQHTSYCTDGSCPLTDFLGTVLTGRFSVLYPV